MCIRDRKKAEKAKGVEPKKKPAPKPVSQEERFRRASLVVDVAAMANFQVRAWPPRVKRSLLNSAFA